MSVTPRSAGRRLAAALVAVVAVAGLVLTGPPADAVGTTGTSRIQGADRYATAANVATSTFSDGAETVVLATGEAFADALAASGMAGALNSPVLLTLKNELPQVTLDALDTLGPTEILLMGGEAAISAGVEETLADSYETVRRVAGDDRYGTAAAAAAEIAATDDSNPFTEDDGLGTTTNDDGDEVVTALLANGLQFPDAVSASPVAYVGRLPILLTGPDSAPQATMDAIADNGIEHVVIVGGTGVVSPAVRQQLENDAEVTTARVAGEGRFQTNTEVAQFGIEQLAMDASTSFLATGRNFPDALVAGPGAGADSNVLFLVEPASLPSPTSAFIELHACVIDSITALGGTAAVSAATVDAAAEAAVADTCAIFDVSPETSSTETVSSSPFNDDGSREFTVSGLEPETAYIVALLDPSVVSSQGGQTRISAYTLTDDASTAIETINGSQHTSGGPAGSGTEAVQVEAESTATGSLAFTIDAADPDSALPIVFLDVNGDGELDLWEDVPDEPHGIGGLTDWEAAA